MLKADRSLRMSPFCARHQALDGLLLIVPWRAFRGSDLGYHSFGSAQGAGQVMRVVQTGRAGIHSLLPQAFCKQGHMPPSLMHGHLPLLSMQLSAFIQTRSLARPSLPQLRLVKPSPLVPEHLGNRRCPVSAFWKAHAAEAIMFRTFVPKHLGKGRMTGQPTSAGRHLSNCLLQRPSFCRTFAAEHLEKGRIAQATSGHHLRRRMLHRPSFFCTAGSKC